MVTARNTFPKKSRLKSRKKLQQLFTGGQKVVAGPIKVMFLVEDSEPVLKCGVGLSGRYFKKAVDRNRIKRLLREAYRLQQHSIQQFCLDKDKALLLFILYTGREIPTYQPLYENVGAALHKLLTHLHARTSQNT